MVTEDLGLLYADDAMHGVVHESPSCLRFNQHPVPGKTDAVVALRGRHARSLKAAIRLQGGNLTEAFTLRVCAA